MKIKEKTTLCQHLNPLYRPFLNAAESSFLHFRKEVVKRVYIYIYRKATRIVKIDKKFLSKETIPSEISAWKRDELEGKSAKERPMKPWMDQGDKQGMFVCCLTI